MHKQFESASELDGYDELKPEDQAKVDKAWEEGKVADEDIPATARREEGEEEKAERTRKKAKVCRTCHAIIPLLISYLYCAEGR